MDSVFYRFPDQPTFRSLAFDAGLISPETAELLTVGYTDGQRFDVHEVGTISQGGEWSYDMDASGNEVVTVIHEPVVLTGWHVNGIGAMPPAWDPYLVVVNSAVATYAGALPFAPDNATLEALVQ